MPAGAQLSLGYRPAHLGHETWAMRLEALRSAINHLGLKEVAFELDVSPSSVCDALSERDRKRFAGEWIDVIVAQLTHRQEQTCDRLAFGIVEPFTALMPITLAPRKTRTIAEKLEDAQRELMRLGQAGLEALERVETGRTR